MSCNAHEIISNLWIGTSNTAKNSNFINDNIEAIVNISELIPNYFHNKKYLRIPINNNPKFIELFKSYLDYAFFFIDNNIKNNKGVLIHSDNEYEIPILLVINYLMRKNNTNYSYNLYIILKKLKITTSKLLHLKNAIIT